MRTSAASENKTPPKKKRKASAIKERQGQPQIHNKKKEKGRVYVGSLNSRKTIEGTLATGPKEKFDRGHFRDKGEETSGVNTR